MFVFSHGVKPGQPGCAGINRWICSAHCHSMLRKMWGSGPIRFFAFWIYFQHFYMIFMFFLKNFNLAAQYQIYESQQPPIRIWLVYQHSEISSSNISVPRRVPISRVSIGWSNGVLVTFCMFYTCPGAIQDESMKAPKLDALGCE